MGLPNMPISWRGLRGQCRHIWHTWSVWDLVFRTCQNNESMKHGAAKFLRSPEIRSLQLAIFGILFEAFIYAMRGSKESP